ncbi:MAG: hypothetical protein ACRYGA_05870 [Janthinobacterium lividum]
MTGTRANPDAAARFARVSSSGIDVNRDHLLLRTPEAQAIAAAVMRYDALLQAAGVANLSPAVRGVQTRYMAAARAA